MLIQSKEDFLMDLKVGNEISRPNSFTFSNISSLNGSSSPVDQQVSKLVKFIQCQKSTVVRRELEMLLPPIVCHLFFEMLKGKEWRPAHDFLRKYSTLVGASQESGTQKMNGTFPSAVSPQAISFLPNSASTVNQQFYHRHPSSSKHQPPQLTQLNIDEHHLTMFKELITHLSCLRRIEDGKDNKLIVNFRSCKYKAKLAKKSLETLNKYLSKHGHVLIIQVLHIWFSMDLYDLQDESIDDSSSSSSDCTILNHFEQFPEVSRHKHRADRSSNPSHCDISHDIKFNARNRVHHSESDAQMSVDEQGCTDNSSSNIKLKRLRDCLQRVDNKYHKPIRIFNINYSDNSLCTASVDKHLCHIAAGFEDSSIVLWSLNGYENYGRKPFQSFNDRLCQWSINNCNRTLSDDLSDYESDEEVAKSLWDDCEVGETDNGICSTSSFSTQMKDQHRKQSFANRYKKKFTIREQWENYAAKSCTENSL